MPAVDPSISRNRAYILRWRGEAIGWLFAMRYWHPLSGGERIFAAMKHSQSKKICDKSVLLTIKMMVGDNVKERA